MSQVEEAPRGVKEIMMGMGDRSGVFKEILALDEARAATAGRSRLRLLRRFEWKRVATTGGYFFPLALLSGVSARLITPSITTALGLAGSYMCSTEGGRSSTSIVNRRTLGCTAILLALHAGAGAALASYLYPAISALPYVIGPDALVASSVILQWWLASLLYYTGPPKEAAAEEEEQQAAANQRGVDEGEGEGAGPDATDAEDDLRDTIEE